MFRFRYKLGNKIIGILVLYFVTAFVAISMTLRVSTQFEGGAAAINDAGSERMRTYRLAYLVGLPAADAETRRALGVEIEAEIGRFEQVLAELEQGNPARPLFLPREPEVRERLRELSQLWLSDVKPMIRAHVAADGRSRLPLADQRLRIERFVARVDDLVAGIERSNSRDTALLRSLQLGLLVLALVGTAILILWFHLTVLRPLAKLRAGIGRMADADFSVRLPIEMRDEFGELADGFNRMAGQMEGLYTTLEQRVEEKTHSLAEQNKELATLYETAAFLSESATIEELCRGFLRRVMANTGAAGGAVRLIDGASHDIHLLIHEGLSDAFAVNEATLCPGECLCGEAARSATPLSLDLERPWPMARRVDCQREGFRSVAAFTIRHQKQLVGIFNLYSRTPHQFSERETHLLETLGQHLGLAIENLRLVSREKEMAVSEERNVLAQELHDSIAQSLAFLNIQAQMLDDALRRGDVADARGSLGPMREGIQESYDHVRELLLHFRTRMHQADLGEALRSALARFEGQTGVATALRQSGAVPDLPPEIELQVLHIVQEALSNVRKHSRAKNVVVEIACGEKERLVKVRDDGIGFDSTQDNFADDHIGLQIMRERAHRIGGRLEVRAAPGEGAEIRLELPLPVVEAAR